MSTLKQRTNWKPTKSNPLVLAPQNNPSKGGRRNINRARLMMSVRNMRLCLCSLTTSAWYGLVLVWTISGANRKAGMKARIGGFACCKALYLLYPKQESKLRLKCCCYLPRLWGKKSKSKLKYSKYCIKQLFSQTIEKEIHSSQSLIGAIRWNADFSVKSLKKILQKQNLTSCYDK